MRLALFSLWVLTSTVPVHAQVSPRPGTELSILDPAYLESNAVHIRSDGGSIRPLTDPARAVAMSTIPVTEQGAGNVAVLIDTLRFRLSPLLQQGSYVRPGKGNDAGMLAEHQLLLEIDGDELILMPVESQYDRKYALRHITAAIINRSPGSYARFAIDNRTSIIVGTIEADEKTYRILPSKLKNTHLVFQMLPAVSEHPTRYSRLSDLIATTPEVAMLENRHVQAEVLADIQPSYYNTNGLTVYLFGDPDGQDKLGVYDPVSLTEPNGIAHLLSTFGPLVGANGDEHYRIEQVDISYDDASGSHLTHIQFRQLIGNIPVRKTNSVSVANTGRIQRLKVTVLDELSLQDVPPTKVSESMALSLAEQALQQSLVKDYPAGSALTQLKQYTEVTYDITKNLKLVPMWRSAFRISSSSINESYYVRVNLLTGDPLVTPLRIPFYTNIYKPDPPGSAPTHVGPNTKLVWLETPLGYTCASSADCTPGAVRPEYDKPKEYISEIEDIWNQEAPDVCCDEMPALIHVIAETSALTFGAWDPVEQTMLLGPSMSQYPEIVAHELGHAYFDSYNFDFRMEAVEAHNDIPADSTGIAIVEGVADTIAALHAELTSFTGDIGADAWILTEGLGLAEKNLTIPRDWGLLEDTNTAYHSRALAVGAFFFRLASTDVVSKERLMTLVLQVSSEIDSGTDGKISKEDLKVALDNATGPTEGSLQDAIDYMWFEPLLLIGADVTDSNDPIIDESLFAHSVSSDGLSPTSTHSIDEDDMWGSSRFVGGAIFMSGNDGDWADYSYFYLEDDKFKFGAGESSKDFTIEFFARTYGRLQTPNPLVTNELPIGSAGSWSLLYRDVYPDDAVLQLRAGTTIVESGSVWPTWPNASWEHIALVRKGDRGMVFVNGALVIDEASIFEETTFSLGADRRLSFGGWSLGDIAGWGNYHGHWDEIRISRGARYTKPFSSLPWARFPRL